ncbi:MAG: divergent PAP2 family protein [Clostridiales bacterium]|nr:divergent PAP2 family protein [Clostridiales bacterium]
MRELLANDILICAATAWLIAQVFKTLIDWRINHTMDLKRLFSNGGMPSAHTASVISLTLMIAFREGLGSTAFAISFVLSAVVINDAVGVRYQTGKQGKVINKILQKVLIEGEPLTDESLKELVGHTPTEAFFGALIGLIVPIFFR